MNIIELITDLFKGGQQETKTPLHIGEVMNLWTFLTATQNFTNSELVALNTVEDKQLSDKMNDLIENFHKPIVSDISDLLLREGVELPKTPVEKPLLAYHAPPGGKMTDEEVANLVMFNIVWAITFCSRGLTEAVRQDVAALFVKGIVHKSTFSVAFKQLLNEKGWLQYPPIYRNEQNRQ